VKTTRALLHILLYQKKGVSEKRCQEPFVRSTRRADSRQMVPDTFFRTGKWFLTPLFAAILSVSAVAVCLAQDDTNDALVEMVVGLLHEQDKEMRSLAFDQIRTECKGQAATERFAAELAKLPPDGQVGLLTALGERGDPAARATVLDMLANSSDESVQAAAINALGFLGEAADTKQLVQSLSADSEAVKAAARASLVRLQGDGVQEAIVAEMKQAPQAVRIRLIEILTTRRALDTIPEILAAAVDDDPFVRVAAMESLGQIAGPEHLPGMVQGVLKAEPGREREAAEKSLMLVCNQIEDADKRAEPLLAAIGELDESERRSMLPTVGRVGGPAALQAIEAAIGSQDPELHEIGIRAICNWPEASIAPRLIDLATTDDHPAHCTAALRALIRVAPLSDDRSDTERLELLKRAMKMCTRDDERKLVLDRARTIRTLESLHFILPYLDQPPYAEQACLSVVELAHYRDLREPNKEEFDRALDKVLETSKNATVIDRAQRYKKGQTWVRPAKPEPAPPVATAKPKSDQPAEAAAVEPKQPTSNPQDTAAKAEDPPRPTPMPVIFAILAILVIMLLAVVFIRKSAK